MPRSAVAKADPLRAACADWQALSAEFERVNRCYGVCLDWLETQQHWRALSDAEQKAAPEACVLAALDQRGAELSEEARRTIMRIARLQTTSLDGLASKLAVLGGVIQPFDNEDAVVLLASTRRDVARMLGARSR